MEHKKDIPSKLHESMFRTGISRIYYGIMHWVQQQYKIIIPKSECAAGAQLNTRAPHLDGKTVKKATRKGRKTGKNMTASITPRVEVGTIRFNISSR